MGLQATKQLPATAPELPPLRQDLTILPSTPFWTGAPSWIIHDPVANKYFRIDQAGLQILSAWKTVSSIDLAKELSETSSQPVEMLEIETLEKFLVSNSLVENSGLDGWLVYQRQNAAMQKSWWKRLAHGYLFFRIPLVRPQGFLDFIWPFAGFLFTRNAALFFAFLAILGLYLVSRQWEIFQATFVGFLTIDGFLLYGISLIGIKCIHEMGHALMARKYGVNVPVIGAAFIVLMPILYTDTTNAHRLNSRFQRLNIDLAGIYAELELASIATILWIFLPDGVLRSIAFTTATLSWVISLAVNLNPFMRFDGYYILSDICGFENLQERSFAIAKWRLRELLFNLGSPPPELLPASWYLPIFLHAWGTWIYRFFLFLGIALLVYTFFIKIVGLVLFFIEIIWFIAAPIWRELKHWWEMREKILSKQRSMLTGSIFAGLLIALFLPFNTHIEIPAVMRMAGVTAIYAPNNAVLVRSHLQEARFVERGDVLAQFTSPDLTEQLILIQMQIDLLKARLARSGVDAEDLSLRPVLQKELEAAMAQKQGVETILDNMTLKAVTSGFLTGITRTLSPGQWMNASTKLALIAPSDTLEIAGLVNEDGIDRITMRNDGYFLPDIYQVPSIPVILVSRSNIAEQTVFEETLADINGGLVPTSMGKDPSSGEDALVPMGAWYSVKLVVANDAQIVKSIMGQQVRGIVSLKGEPQSYGARMAKRVASVLLRELSP